MLLILPEDGGQDEKEGYLISMAEQKRYSIPIPLKTNVSLIGMPSCGKTSLGQRLARKFDMHWAELDVPGYNKPLDGRIIQKEFLRQEEESLLGAKGTNTVFSCGGSSIYSRRGMCHLRDISCLVYLNLPLRVIQERLGDDYLKRGIFGLDIFTLEELYKQRGVLYNRYGDIAVDCDNNSIEEQFDCLCRLFKG